MKKVAWLVLALFLTGCGVTYSEGQRVGVVFKISKKGYFWKTWEADMNVGGVSQNADGVMVPNMWSFSVCHPTEELLAKIMLANESGKKVKIEYKQVMMQWPSWGKTDYCAVDVR